MSIQAVNLQTAKPSVFASISPAKSNPNQDTETVAQKPKKQLSPWKYALASAVIPGAGQFGQDRKEDAIKQLANTALFLLALIPAGIPMPRSKGSAIVKLLFTSIGILGATGVRIYSMIDAYKGAKKLNTQA